MCNRSKKNSKRKLDTPSRRSFNKKEDAPCLWCILFMINYILLYLLNLLHSLQFPALKLHDDFMQLGALAKSLHPWGYGITLDLLLSFSPLLLSLGNVFLFAIGILYLHLLVPFLLAQHFQLQDVAVLGRVMRQVWQEEEVAIAMIQL